MKLTTTESNNLIIKKSRNGSGIFTKKDFKNGETIFEVRGKLISCDEDDDIDDEVRSNTYRYDADLYLSPHGTLGDMLNHSCSPNSKVVKSSKKLLIIAIKNIKTGQEVLIDYSTIIAPDDVWKMSCNCGSSKCRGKIGKFKLLPKELKEKYLKLGMVPDYIL